MFSSKFKILLFVTLALLATAMYFAATQFATVAEQDGDPMSDFKAPQATAPPAPSSRDSAGDLAPVEVMLIGLRQRLETQPDDVDGWVLLSKSYYHLKRWQEADEAFKKAKNLGYVGRWQPLPPIDAFSQNGASSEKFTAAIEFRDYKTKKEADETGSNGAGGLRLKVSLNPTLEKEFSATSAVFVFVRAAQNPGPPLAVVRRQVDELPFEIALNDGHAMIAGRTISNAENVIVGARISVSGSPERRAGDYEKLSGSLPADFSETIELVISDKI